MCTKYDPFSEETFKNKIFFIDEDLILFELEQKHEVIFYVPE